MPAGKIRVIAAKELETDIVAVETSPSEITTEKVYLDNLRRLARGEHATFGGRAVDKESGVVYQIFTAPKTETEEGMTFFVEDRPATKILASLVDAEGQVRRIQVL